MKSIEEKARDYILTELESNGYRNLHGIDCVSCAFTTGYKSAFDWISVEDELPTIKEEPYYVVVKSSKKTEKGIVEEPGLWQITSDSQIGYLADYCTHWRYFNLEDIK